MTSQHQQQAQHADTPRLAGQAVAPRGVYVCGNTTSTSGLTVTLVRDPQTGDQGLE